MAEHFFSLTANLDSRRPVVVQTHDYPDIDAVASAWSLASLLRRQGYETFCVFKGEIRSRSLNSLIKKLNIDLSPATDALSPAVHIHTAQLYPELQVIVVDGSPGNGNVTLAAGELVGIIDHHCRSKEVRAPFLDLRPELAACSTIIRGYWEEAGEELPRDTATALLAGIQSDTDFLSRRCSGEDFAAYSALYRAGDWELASRVVRTVLDLRELKLIVTAIETAIVRDGLLFAFLIGPCGQEALAVLAELALRAEELFVAVVAEKDEAGVHFSVRSKNGSISAFDLVKAALEGLGTGGGHAHSAGGIVPSGSDPGEDALRERFYTAAAAAKP